MFFMILAVNLLVAAVSAQEPHIQESWDQTVPLLSEQLIASIDKSPINLASKQEESELTVLKSRFPHQAYNFADTTPGFTHYQDLGLPDRPTVVLVHGVSGPLSVWDHNVNVLAAAGYRVIRYDLLGRGLSERLIKTNYGLSVYLEQLDSLLSKINVNRPIYLVGSSFGAIVGASPPRAAGISQKSLLRRWSGLGRFRP
ncbi:MAG: hypothetical protein A3J74_05580 [Elusimicrobia bacterium RIFCSPHIGHO2_02_FULL_57_9]|nr:MAG: hypothetical protein A3J74_05580 [Elusimicrobia bacterium RIFCSPHIGHO2_02_FULL_57_9]